VFGYYCVGLPLAWFLSFHHSWGLVGLWTAQATALASVAVIELSIYFLLINWRNEIEKVERRAEEDEGEREALLGE
jgi:Na+-driven multidrug efflux pump